MESYQPFPLPKASFDNVSALILSLLSMCSILTILNRVNIVNTFWWYAVRSASFTWKLSFTWPTISCESLRQIRCLASMSSASARPAMRASYSA